MGGSNHIFGVSPFAMAYREFSDSEKIQWRVWATYPTSGGILSKGFEHGWLTFESGSECRRLAPIPDRWEEASEAKLRTYLGESKASKRKTLST